MEKGFCELGSSGVFGAGRIRVRISSRECATLFPAHPQGKVLFPLRNGVVPFESAADGTVETKGIKNVVVVWPVFLSELRDVDVSV